MHRPSKVRAWVRACFKLAVRIFRVLFILALVALPGPLAVLVASLVEPAARRNLPAETVHRRR